MNIVSTAVASSLNTSRKWGSSTFGNELKATGGIAPGFDCLRIVLSVSVLLYHCFLYTNSPAWQRQTLSGTFGPVILMLVPMFFALSGFLVTGSLLRARTLKVFLVFRGLRIIPALVTEVVLSALVLGAIVTTLPLQDYFAHPEFWGYFTNIFGFVKFKLPGVFETHQRTAVNGALWTVPGEMLCYLTLSALMIFRVARCRSYMLAAFVLLIIGLYVHGLLVPRSPIYGTGWRVTQSWHGLIACFYAGGLLLHFRNVVPKSAVLALFCLVMSYISIRWVPQLYLACGAITTAYVICYLGMLELPRLPFKGDYSYGIYLYHLPIIQTLLWLSPVFAAWYVIFPTSLVAVAISAALSWHFIEAPALNLKKQLTSPDQVLNRHLA